MTIALALAVMVAAVAAEPRGGAGTAAGAAVAEPHGGAETPAMAEPHGGAETPAMAEPRRGETAGAAAAPVKTRCTARETRTAVRRFVAELNRGDLRALDRRFAPAERFEWYSTDAPGERFDDASKDRASLMPYFKARHAEHERLTLRRFRFNGASAAKYGNFEYTLTRRADDLRRPTRYEGKGAAWCHRGSADELFVWSMASARAG